MFADPSLAIHHDQAGDHVIHEIPVVADQEYGSLEAQQDFFQQFQGFDIQVVGRLIQNQEVGRLAEQFCQHGPVLFATGQGFDRHAHPLRAEQEFTQVGNGMASPAVYLDKILAAADIVDQVLFGIELLA